MMTYYFPQPRPDDAEYPYSDTIGYIVVKTTWGKDEAVEASAKFHVELSEAWGHARKLAGPGATLTTLPAGELQGAYRKAR